ncbi:SGNH/GDSL hydrolase family protein [Lactiplantibacillus plantarum]|uniref:SGNH/GDSL hydrolase family protein n=1 Tax=Lactiplantibacillus plantarum TaxID=1590 RepID=UPI00287325FF|nr:SGNH/GDSL hydrolase family protein [Lactiplantibacillus plantarum]WNC19909.1 SGNH/GDSL hydrolase family protein [Lactiplantibacillus plantarum]
MEKLKTNELSLGLNQTFRNDLIDNFEKIQNGVDGQSDTLNKQITDLLGNVAPQDQNEVTQARIDVHGNAYGTLKSREDSTQATAETALSEERNTSAEVQDARTNSNSKTYPTLKERLDNQENDLNNSINNKLSQISSVPEAFTNLAAIKSKYPNGSNGIMVAADNGHKYIWANSTWTDAGSYQSPISLNQMGTINAYHNAPVVITQNVDGDSTYWYMRIPKAFITSADGSYRTFLDPSNPVSSDGNNGWDLTHIATKGGYLCWDKVNNRINPYLTNEAFTKNDIIIGFVWSDGDFSFLGNANYTFNGGYKQSFEPSIGMFVGSRNNWSVSVTSTSWQLNYGIGWITTGRKSILIANGGSIDVTSLMDVGGYICSDPKGTISAYKTGITIPPTLYVIGMLWYDGTVKMFGYSAITSPLKGFLTGYGNKASLRYLTAVKGTARNIFLSVYGGFPSVISPEESKVYQSASSDPKGFDLSPIVDGGYIVFDKSTNRIYGVPYASFKNMDKTNVIVGWGDINYVQLNTDIPYEMNGLPINTDSPFIAENKLSILTTGDSVTKGFLGTGIVAPNPYPSYVASILKCQVDNVAVSGKWLSKTSDGSLMPVLQANDLTKYSIVTIAYGINDWNDGLPLTDVTTALQNAINYIWQQNPNIRIVGITPSPVWTHRGNAVDLTTPNSAGVNQKDFINALVNVYDANQIPVFNLLKYPIVTKSGWKTQSIDGIHPTENTHKILGTRIATFLKLNV